MRWGQWPRGRELTGNARVLGRRWPASPGCGSDRGGWDEEPAGLTWLQFPLAFCVLSAALTTTTLRGLEQRRVSVSQFTWPETQQESHGLTARCPQAAFLPRSPRRSPPLSCIPWLPAPSLPPPNQQPGVSRSLLPSPRLSLTTALWTPCSHWATCTGRTTSHLRVLRLRDVRAPFATGSNYSQVLGTRTP